MTTTGARSLRGAALVLALLPAGLVGCDGLGRDTKLTVGTPLPAALARAVEEAFEAEHPTVDVRIVDTEGRTLDELSEGAADPPFDVWWGAPGLTLTRAAAAGELLAYRPPWAAAGGEAAGDDSWHPLLATPFVVAFNREATELVRAPTDWIDVFHLRWNQEIWMLDPRTSAEGAYFVGAIVAQALRDEGDLDAGFDWLGRLDGQVEQYTADPAVALRALQTGDGHLAIVPKAVADRARADGAAWLYYRLPESGTPMLVLGAAIVDGTKQPDAARAFIDFLGRSAVATASKRQTWWDPLVGDVDGTDLPRDVEIEGRLRPYPLALDTLAAELDGWVDRWELEKAER